jgi:hypothetical protein
MQTYDSWSGEWRRRPMTVEVGNEDADLWQLKWGMKMQTCDSWSGEWRCRPMTVEVGNEDSIEQMLYIAHVVVLRQLNRGWCSAVVMRWVGHLAGMWETRTVNRVLVGKSVGNWPVLRPSETWKIHFKTNVKETGCELWRAVVLKLEVC